MLEETSRIVGKNLNFLPLKNYVNIVQGNALRMDWEKVCHLRVISEEAKATEEYMYILGNPPFVGFTYMSAEQKKDMDSLFPCIKNLDFVCGWYKKANDYIKNTKIECGLVSTNSITQAKLLQDFGSKLILK